MASYKLKFVPFNGTDAPIVLQNDNGPCPLISVANVLILRGQLRIPSQAPDISQDRLMSLVAEHLLDTNLAVDDASRYAADLRQNLQDVISVLPKMATGVDVNPKFESIRGFEFTNEIAIFDLMNISLVHGWLVDPEDKRHAEVLRNQSYNQIVSRLVAILGEQAPMHLLTPQSSFSSTAGSAPQGPLASVRSASIELGQKRPFAGEDKGQMTSSACPETKDNVSTTDAPPVEMQTGLQSDRDTCGDYEFQGGVENGEEAAGAVVKQVVNSIINAVLAASSSDAGHPARSSPPEGGPPATGAEGGSGPAEPSRTGEAGDGNRSRSRPSKKVKSAEELEKESKDAEFAKIVQEFLETASSQLTVYGLHQLHAGLNNRELAVFFRNNHFNTLYKHNGALYILVTDQGYISEKGVVWEKLDAVDNDTQFFTSDFLPYTKAETVPDASEEEVALQRALVESVAGNQGVGGGGNHGSLPPDFLAVPEETAQDQGLQQQQPTSIPQPCEDADFALALQLHEEMLQEEERVRHEATRQQQQQGGRAQYSATQPQQRAANPHIQGRVGRQTAGYHARDQMPPSGGGMGHGQRQGYVPRPGVMSAQRDQQGRQQQEQGEPSMVQKMWSRFQGLFKNS